MGERNDMAQTGIERNNERVKVYIIVTGSRKEFNITRIEKGLRNIWHMLHNSSLGYPEATLIHGDAQGVDKMAGVVAYSWGWNVICMPANWNEYGKGAGPVRNQEMIDKALSLGFNETNRIVCAAFPLLGSIGTWDCIKRAAAAKIKCVIFPHD